MVQVVGAGQVIYLAQVTYIDINRAVEVNMWTIEGLERERREREREALRGTEEEEKEGKCPQNTCKDLEVEFGPDYIERLTSFTAEEVDEIMEVCAETLKPVGPGRRYCDMRYRVIVYLTWLVSGWTIEGLAKLFRMSPSTVQRTITYVMSGLTYSLRAAYLPVTKEDIHPTRKFEHFPQAIGAVDATLIQIQKPKERELNNEYFSGKHRIHGAKVQVTVDADGHAMHVSPVIPGRRHDAFLFRQSGLPEFMKETRRVSGRTVVTHPALLADSGYIGLDEVYYELITSKKKPPHGSLSQKDEETNQKLHSDRVLVENFFGRLKLVFKILDGKYRCSLDSLEHVVITCICLLNLKMKRQPLRSDSRSIEPIDHYNEDEEISGDTPNGTKYKRNPVQKKNNGSSEKRLMKIRRGSLTYNNNNGDSNTTLSDSNSNFINE